MQKGSGKMKNVTEAKISVKDLYEETGVLSREDFIKEYNINTNGLSEQEAEELLEFHGENVIEKTQEKPWFIKLVKSFLDPFSLILIAISIVLFIMGEYSSVTIIIFIVIVGGLMEFIQEFRSSNAAEKLKEMVSSTCTVLRDEEVKEISMAEVVPGDIIGLSAGDMIPADVRIISNKDLFIGQSSLTGESEPIEKFTETTKKSIEEVTSLSDLDNICFMGTNVISGSAQAVVISTGNETYFGNMAEDLSAEKPKTAFEKGVDNIGGLLIKSTLIMVPIIFLSVFITKGNFFEALLFSVAIAVGLTPELLPMILSSTLARGAVVLSKRKTIVKSLNSIQSFGAMDILCTDKTGTLTEDKIILEKYLDIHGNPDNRVLRHAFLNSYFQTGLRNAMDIAIINRAKQNELFESVERFEKVDEIPFDFNRRRMSVVLMDKTLKRQLITKGAVEEMLSICSWAEYQGNVIPLTSNIKEEALEIIEELSKDGLRVIAVAQKNEIHDVSTFGIGDESEMVLLGFVGFLDPPKASAKTSIELLNKNGVRVIVLTGDNELVTKSVCSRVGINTKDVVLGTQIEEMSDEELYDVAKRCDIFAKLSPMEKSRIINVLQNNNHTVGFMGDGINDSLALTNSDVGISVDTAVDIAKESADIILLEKDLNVLEKGVLEGRKTFGNLIKYVKMAVSSNFGNMFSVLAASIVLPFLPITPIQILIQNLFYDISQVAIPFDNVDKEYVNKPRTWNTKSVARFMIHLGPISSIFDIIMFLVLWFILKINTVEQQIAFQTGFFVYGLLSQTVIVNIIRTGKLNIIKNRGSKLLIISTIIVAVLACVLPFTGLSRLIGLVILPAQYYGYLIAICAVYAVLLQVVKKVYTRRYKEWL